MPEDSETPREGPRHAAETGRRRRTSPGRSARLGRARLRRADGTTGEQDDASGTAAESTGDESPVETPVATPVDEAAAEVSAEDAGESTEATPRDDPADPPKAEPPVAESQAAKGPEERSRGRERLTAALSRPGRGQVIAAVLLLLFGLSIVTQIRLTTEDSTYANARREDLIQLLDGLTQENRRLEGEVGDLERTKNNLESGADAQQVAREEAARRIEVLSILAGTVPAEGQGIRMTISDPQNKVTAEILLDAIEEMRDAGAEVIEINDSIRLVASSWFGVDQNGQLVVDGKPVTKPITIEVIGDPHSLSEGANFRGGIVSEISSSKVGGSVQIDQLQNLTIDSLHTPKPNQYARPASPEPTR